MLLPSVSGTLLPLSAITSTYSFPLVPSGTVTFVVVVYASFGPSAAWLPTRARNIAVPASYVVVGER